LMEVPDPIAGQIHVSGRMVKYSRSGMPVGSAPTVGQHNEEILCELLGKSDEDIAGLRERGVIG
ncbi:MAG: CoA transferase, partial [Chloroflexota bacterium]